MLNFNLFSKNDVIAVALSGGKDSMCLLHLLISATNRLGITVKAINVEHGIRGEQSKKDSEFVFNYCKNNGIPLCQTSFNCVEYAKENGLSIEESARKLRYGYFKTLLNDGFCDKIATAHHLSDNVETALLNLFRGVSPSGFGGIPETAFDGKIIRPILRVEKSQIDEYVLKHSIPFVTDESNFSSDYSRNFLRLEVIPLIKKRFPEMETAVERFLKIAEDENKFLNQLANALIEPIGGGVSINCQANDAIFRRACVVAMKGVGIVKDYEKAHIDLLVDLKNGETGRKINLLNGVVAIKEYQKIVMFKQVDNYFEEVDFKLGEYKILDKTVVVSKVLTPDFSQMGESKVLYFDGDKIPVGAKIRFRRENDKFTKFGGGTKPLGDYLTDKKIPLRVRDLIPIIASGNEVLVVVGVEISQKVKIDENTKNIVQIKFN